MKFRPHGRLLFLILVVVARLLQSGPALGQSPAPTEAATADDAAKRLQWLKARVPGAVPPATPAAPKKRFAITRTSDLRPIELPRESTPAPSKESTPTPSRTAKTAPDSTPTPAKTAKATPTARPAATPTPAVAVNEPPARKSTPAPKTVTASTSTSARDLLSIPAQSTKLAPPQPTPDPYRLPPIPRSVGGRYPWKTNIVTTVFWIGEAPSGNNLTPNHASSWDPNWAGAYGGFDNPDPQHRRNFIPVAFTPRQNPFYIALPYNDVTRGTTKPESRLVIPWFKSAFQREGQSVCRDRWVAVRSRSGKVGYAQWSDCGPFRTDHWQYVFGNERPRPNLNNGAGLDVSPALRDFLRLQSTDVTDWKFIDARDVPAGPWSRYGENNTFAQKGSSRAR